MRLPTSTAPPSTMACMRRAISHLPIQKPVMILDLPLKFSNIRRMIFLNALLHVMREQKCSQVEISYRLGKESSAFKLLLSIRAAKSMCHLRPIAIHFCCTNCLHTSCWDAWQNHVKQRKGKTTGFRAGQTNRKIFFDCQRLLAKHFGYKYTTSDHQRGFLPRHLTKLIGCSACTCRHISTYIFIVQKTKVVTTQIQPPQHAHTLGEMTVGVFRTVFCTHMERMLCNIFFIGGK